jgi:putative protein-disulfide isomerase
MEPAMREMLQQTWKRIQLVIPGTEFNFDFWQINEPRRSTYPANRAVIAARLQGEQYDAAMTVRIQRAYYLEARNPSNNDTLIELAADIGLNATQFATDLTAASTHAGLLDEIQRARGLGINGFPSLAVVSPAGLYHIGLNYLDAQPMLEQIESI